MTTDSSLSLAQQYALALMDRAEAELENPNISAWLRHVWQLEMSRARRIFHSNKRR